MFKNKTILVVDDEPDLKEIIASEFEYMGAKVFQAQNVTEAKSILEIQKIDLVVSDIRMPGGDGIDLVRYLRTKALPGPAIILITGFADISYEDAYNLGVESLISKPFNLDELIQMGLKLLNPPEKRYLPLNQNGVKDLSLTFDQYLNSKIQAKECSIGRGGISLTVDASSFTNSTHELQNFHLKFKDVELLGTAFCRWSKFQKERGKVSFGLEFEQLSGPTFKYIQEYLSRHSLIPYIPSLN